MVKTTNCEVRKMKTAKVFVTEIYFECPYCNHMYIMEGSDKGDAEGNIEPMQGDKFKCTKCKKTFISEGRWD
mgnify:CR=1 FL=1